MMNGAAICVAPTAAAALMIVRRLTLVEDFSLLICPLLQLLTLLRARAFTQCRQPGPTRLPATLLPTWGIVFIPGKTYACSRAIRPITAAPGIEYQNAVRKIGPSA